MSILKGDLFLCLFGCPAAVSTQSIRSQLKSVYSRCTLDRSLATEWFSILVLLGFKSMFLWFLFDRK